MSTFLKSLRTPHAFSCMEMKELDLNGKLGMEDESDDPEKNDPVIYLMLKPQLNTVEKCCYQDAELIDLYDTLRSKMAIIQSSKSRQASISDLLKYTKNQSNAL